MRHFAGEINKSVPDCHSSSPVTLKTEVYALSDWLRVADVYARLAEGSPYRSFYLGIEWISTWLEVFGESFDPRILVFEEEGQAVGVCLLIRVCERRGPFRIRRMYLNCGGEPESERTLVEFNSILCRCGMEDLVAEALGRYAITEQWDEFAIQGMTTGRVLEALQAKAFSKLTASIRLQPTYTVNLREARRAGKRYLDILSANTRGQIRRSLRLYHDPMRVEIAKELDTAQEYFEEMCALHQARWRARGETGAFQPGRRLEFHRALIRRAFASGAIHLVRVSAGNHTVGILYNFVERGKICFFQCGFRYTDDPRLKPGLVTHACAIQNYMEIGFDEYDFLAGSARYKASLAKESTPLAWVVFARPGIRLATIELLRTLKRQLRRNRSGKSPEVSSAVGYRPDGLQSHAPANCVLPEREVQSTPALLAAVETKSDEA